jgi:hypothetical protein
MHLSASCILPSAFTGPWELGTGDRALPLHSPTQKRSNTMYLIIAILLILWLLGLITSYTLGGFLHILLVVAIILLIIRLVSGRRVV